MDPEEAIGRLETLGFPFHVWLEVDCGQHRTGVDPHAEGVVELARRLEGSPVLEFDGLLTHSGHAYDAASEDEVAKVAAQERDVTVELAEKLRARGVEVPEISVGSTPAMNAVDHLRGVTEARPGNYVFYDFTQVSLASCQPSDCAVSVLATVVSAQPTGGHCVVDAGALALSKDPGRGGLPRPTMGEIFDDYRVGTLRPDARLVSLTQEHGLVSAPLPVGSRVRILPNHSCLTAACFDHYDVVQGDKVVDEWKIWRGR